MFSAKHKYRKRLLIYLRRNQHPHTPAFIASVHTRAQISVRAHHSSLANPSHGSPVTKAPVEDKRIATEMSSGNMSRITKTSQETHGPSAGASGKAPENYASPDGFTSPPPPPPSPASSRVGTLDDRYSTHSPTADAEDGTVEKLEVLCTVIADSFDSGDRVTPSIKVQRCEGQRSLPIRGPPEPESMTILGHSNDRNQSWKGENVRVVFTRGRLDMFYKVSVVYLQYPGSTS